ncbi:MAG: 30S ribosomal protein S11 [Candidatus Moranbacteria bacterium GW2011_GWF2_34_56]|nr:MAG: 30S ribosomal protein S11 [Candidatus Moranbacteria bacterium GW2011_GWF1_34_10]KKP64969.1 MAG: 30S ribosomal protein S11 [Candidatus Moranbacteria bacterium GW2011_GWF2_34_56]
MTEEKDTIQEQEIKTPVIAEVIKPENQTVQAKKGKKSVFKGQAHIQCTYNNTIITISDMNGATLGWSSSGMLGFKGAKKSTPFAATKVASDVSEKVKKFGLKELMIFIKGVGGGRESAVRGLSGAGFDVISIKDITPAPHNGCRRRKPRRV